MHVDAYKGVYKRSWNDAKHSTQADMQVDLRPTYQVVAEQHSKKKKKYRINRSRT